MIRLHPDPYKKFHCPSCKGNDINLEKIIFQGIHLLADARCTVCGFTFYQDFPTGHGIVDPVVIDKTGLKLLSPANREWFSGPLLRSLSKPSDENIEIRKIINNDNKTGKVILLNCLDAWYGHVLLKLFNLQFYHKQYPDLKKIVLIPAGFEWMIPGYADEIWVANIKLSATKQYFLKLDQFIQAELLNYGELYYSMGYSHPPLQEVDTVSFFKTAPFNIKNFDAAVPTITFIYRQDRLWLHPLINKLSNFVKNNRLPFSGIFLWWQLRKINKLYREVIKIIPNAQFYVCGPGTAGKVNNGIIDKRTNQITKETELEWCKIYAESHVVAGIHGSNMLIPSALAASFVEILPNDRISNITQDVFCKHSYNTMTFLGQFASEYDPVKRVAGIITSIILYYKSFQAHQQHNYNTITE